jgi:hypothetical protein
VDKTRFQTLFPLIDATGGAAGYSVKDTDASSENCKVTLIGSVQPRILGTIFPFTPMGESTRVDFLLGVNLISVFYHTSASGPLPRPSSTEKQMKRDNTCQFLRKLVSAQCRFFVHENKLCEVRISALYLFIFQLEYTDGGLAVRNLYIEIIEKHKVSYDPYSAEGLYCFLDKLILKFDVAAARSAMDVVGVYNVKTSTNLTPSKITKYNALIAAKINLMLLAGFKLALTVSKQPSVLHPLPRPEVLTIINHHNFNEAIIVRILVVI